MMMKKLAIASAIALVCMSAAQAQVTAPESTPTQNATQDNAAGLLSALTASLADVFNAGRASTITDAIVGVPPTYAAYTEGDLRPRYTINPTTGEYVPSATGTLVMTNPGTVGVARTTSFSTLNPVDITALAGAVNLSTINGSIDISGTNVSITGVAGDVGAKAESIATTTSTATSFAINGNNFSTTVIGAMNSSTLDMMAKVTDKTNVASSGLAVETLASQGGSIALATPSVTPVTDSIGSTIASIDVLNGTSLVDASGTEPVFSNLQQNLSGLDAVTSSNVTESVHELQSMNVFNMALNMAPIVAGVQIAAVVDPNAWFLNPQTGIVNVSNLQLATTAIGAMNSSVTRLGANLANLAE